MTITKIIMTAFITPFVIASLLCAQDIFLSVENGDIRTVGTILKRDPDAVKAKNNDGDSPLHIAVLKGHIDIVKFLLTQNPDLEIKNNKGFTPLLYASWMFHRESRMDYRRIIELLLAHGAEANTTGDGGYNPLHWINHPSENNLTDILELNALFISKGVDVNAQNIYGSTPLHYAVHIHTKTARILIENKADVNVKDKQGRTPLFRISGFDHPEAASTVRLLINNGALINTQDNNGKTAVERALTNGRKDIADILISYQNNSDIEEFPVLKGAYLGQKPPGMQRSIFAPGIVSTGYNEHCVTFTPDGKEVFYRLLGPPHGVILTMKEENGLWTPPQVASFSGKYDGKCSLSPDGNTILISSGSPPSGKGPVLDYWTIWIIKRTDSGWGKPRNLPHLRGAYPTMSNLGTIYFYAWDENNLGDIYRSSYKDGEYGEAQKVEAPINTEYWENDPYIAHDESYIIFQSDRPGTLGEGDLFISYRLDDGSWSVPVNMGKGVNTKESGEACPFVSPDGKYLFFSGVYRNFPSYSEAPLTLTEKLKIFNQPGYGSEDVFWVSAKIIEDLKPDELK